MKELPISVRRSIELIGLCLIGLLVVVGNNVLMPLLMAFFVAIMLLPVYRFLRRRKFPEVVAIICSIFFGVIIILIIVGFFSLQISQLVEDLPQIQENLTSHWQRLSAWINNKTEFSSKEQLAWMNKQGSSMFKNTSSYLGGAFSSVGNTIVFIGLMPIYIFLLLYYKGLLVQFTFLWFQKSDHGKVRSAINETESIIKSYLLGLLIQITYITILLGGILLMFGIKHAFLIGIIFGILNLIPYIGALFGNLIGVLLTVSSSDKLSDVLIVLLVITFVQFLDNNILMPRIVGGKVRLNALVSIVGVFIGGALAGVAGMFLSLPVMAVLKIVFDRSDNFQKWGLLLGDVKEPKKLVPIKLGRKTSTDADKNS